MDRMTDEAMRDEQKTMEQQLTETRKALFEEKRGHNSTFILMCIWMVLAAGGAMLAATLFERTRELGGQVDILSADHGWTLHQCNDALAAQAAEHEALRAHARSLEQQLSDADVVRQRCSQFVDLVNETFLGHRR